MVALGLRNRTDLVDEREGLRNIFESIQPFEMALGIQRPASTESSFGRVCA